MARPDPVPASRHWLMSGLSLLAIGCATASLGSVLADITWWFVAMLIATVMLLAAAVVRTLSRGRWWPTLAAFVAGVFLITGIFVPDSAFLFVIPTFDSPAAFRVVEQAGLASIAEQDIPAIATTGILYLVCVGIAAITFFVDAAAQLFRAPALAGIPLLVLLLVPSFVRPELADAFLFALTAAAFLGMLLLGANRGGRRLAVGLGAGTIAAALLLPLALPAPQAGVVGQGSASGAATGINPILTLGDDLRRANPSLALTYTTSSTDAVYLRLTALDDFRGVSWEPTETETIPGNDVAEIGPIPGLGEGIPTIPVTTEVTVGNILSRWLPVPYAPEGITGLEGDWSWEPDALSVRTGTSNARGQLYEVSSVQVAPSIDQLVAAGTIIDPGMERYLALPPDVPAIVATTAADVTAGAATNYDKAIALQAYFTGGEFTYSESAPVEQGYDGSGAQVLAQFLDVKSGYCVHFSSAMASMARTLGIPARVAVGFTPGELVGPADDSEYRVSTDNLHAWPELYFSGIGWVRFEPTPGRGEAPRFAPLAVDDPTTPDVDESVPPPAPTAAATDPTAAPSSAPSAVPDDQADPTAAPAATTVSVPWWSIVIALVVILLLAPWFVRAIRRSRRLAAAASGSAVEGWVELRDTADDLGLKTTDSRTPRQLSADLAPQLSDDAAAALARLRAAVEAEAFAEPLDIPDATATLGDDTRTVLRSLRRGVPLGSRLVAAFLPRSLFAPWIAQASAFNGFGSNPPT